MENWSEYTRLFIALTVIMDPFMALPILMADTQGFSRPERARVVRIAVFTVTVVLLVTAWSGESVLQWMGTSLGSFRVGGGIVLLLMALAMLQARTDRSRTSPDEQQDMASRASIGVVPLAIPLLAGPGAISTVIIAMNRSQAEMHGIMVSVVIVAVAMVLWLVLHLAEPIARALGDIGLKILHRLFGLILAAIAVEVMSNGLKDLFPVLAGH